MPDEISVRQWLEKFHACLQGPKDFTAQFKDDWYDSFFSDNNEMRRRVSRFAGLAAAITDPYILDNYYIWFYEHSMPFSGKPYDDIRFDPLSGERNGQYFLVSLNRAGRKNGRCTATGSVIPHRNLNVAMYAEWPNT